jgi:ABC-type siderophore export system fused ATPase/permease subunit
MSKQKNTQRDRGKQIADHARTNPGQSANDNASTPEESRHFQIGWWGLLFFVGLGILLEGLMAFRIGWYMDVNNDTRRLMLRLGHAHGTLLSLVNIAFAATLARTTLSKISRLWASRFIVAATLLIPGGFILGGVQIYDADPGPGIILLPAGAVLLLFGIFQVARNIGK